MLPKYEIGQKLWHFNERVFQFVQIEVNAIILEKSSISYRTSGNIYFQENALFKTKSDGIDALQEKLEMMRDIHHETKSKFKLFLGPK